MSENENSQLGPSAGDLELMRCSKKERYCALGFLKVPCADQGALLVGVSVGRS